MNHVINPFVRWILGSRLHGLLSKNVMLVSFQGRKSGKHYVTPVKYTRQGQEVWVGVGYAQKKQWWRNLSGVTLVNVCLRGEWQSGQAQVFKGEADREQLLHGISVMRRSDPSKNSPSTTENSHDSLNSLVMVRIILD